MTHKEHAAFELYARYGFAGALCASGAHLVLVPIDVVKTRLQVQPGRYKRIGDAFRTMVREEGPRSILLGLSPTVAGYAVQGACKFGFYEFFKSKAVGWIGEETRAGLFGGLAKLASQEGVLGLYKGLPPLLGKQLPYTMVQLSAFTYFVDKAYGYLESVYGIHKSDMSGRAQIAVSISCGVCAGVLSSIASHPPDTILSRINMNAKTGKQSQSMAAVARELGFKGLWLGVGLRCVFTGLLTATIFFVYDGVKLLFGLKTTSGLRAKKLAAQDYKLCARCQAGLAFPSSRPMGSLVAPCAPTPNKKKKTLTLFSITIAALPQKATG